MKAMSFSTYLVDAPRYGGPLRANALHRILRARGWSLLHLCITIEEIPVPPAPNHVVFKQSEGYVARVREHEGRTDVDASGFVTSDERHLDRFMKAIDHFDPDLLILEQPWLWPALKVYLTQRSRPWPVIIYSSHNVEEQLIVPLVSELQPENKSRILRQVRDLERELVEASDGIIAVSEADKEYFRESGKPTIVAPNGVWQRAEPGGKDYWTGELSWLSFMLFVGSAHPPNATGYVNMLGPALTYLAPDERIVIVGGVTGLLAKDEKTRPYRGINAARTIALGVQDDPSLSTMIELCKGIVLPITAGGGTNLKTAEALYNRLPIVGTSAAFRGYEAFMDFPGVRICDDEKAFKAGVVDILRNPRKPVQHSFHQRMMLERLLWSSTLAEVPSFIDTAVKMKAETAHRLHGTDGRADSSEVGIEVDLLKNLGFGWHPIEPTGVWTSERVACMALRDVAPCDDHAIVEVFLSVDGIISPEIATAFSSTLNIFTNSGRQYTYALTKKDASVVVPVHLTPADAAPSGAYEIFLQTSRLDSPQRLGISSDHRRLGIFLESARVYNSIVVIPESAVERHDNGLYYSCAPSDPEENGWLVLNRAGSQGDETFRVARLIQTGSDNLGFLSDAYNIMLNRELDKHGTGTYIPLLDEGVMGRSELIKTLLDSEEAKKFGRRLVVELSENVRAAPVGHRFLCEGSEYMVLVARAEA